MWPCVQVATDEAVALRAELDTEHMRRLHLENLYVVTQLPRSSKFMPFFLYIFCAFRSILRAHSDSRCT
eukprot:COSAG02_NODE_9537_length_2186_cov_3.102060_3_plen_69_part_00